MKPGFVDAIWDVLVEKCGADEAGREDYRREMHRSGFPREWRFMGSLGFGGKVWCDSSGRFYVTCYREDETPERLAMIDDANVRLALLSEAS